MEQTDLNMGLSRFVHVDHFWKWLCNNVAEVSNLPVISGVRHLIMG
jgi:hypothetical protein